MELPEIVKTLRRYSEQLIAYKLDAEFAYAVTEAANRLELMQSDHVDDANTATYDD